MNYINFSDKNYDLGNLFKEVDINEQCRVDAIIADISYFYKNGNIYSNGGRRNQLFDKFVELCKTQGQRFVLLEVSEDILYSESDELQEVILGIQRETRCYFELRGVCSQSFKKEQQINIFKYFFIFYYDNVLVFDDSDYAYCIKNYTINKSNNKYLNIIDYVFLKIKENLL